MSLRILDKDAALQIQHKIWTDIRGYHDQEEFSLEDLQRKYPYQRLALMMKFLCSEGYVSETRHKARRKYYRINRADAYIPLHDSLGRPDQEWLKISQLWRSMKMLKKWSLNDLAVAASTDDVTISTKQAWPYVLFLEKAGYLRRYSGPVWALLPSKNTGGQPPLMKSVKGLHDINNGDFTVLEARHVY